MLSFVRICLLGVFSWSILLLLSLLPQTAAADNCDTWCRMKQGYYNCLSGSFVAWDIPDCSWCPGVGAANRCGPGGSNGNQNCRDTRQPLVRRLNGAGKMLCDCTGVWTVEALEIPALIGKIDSTVSVCQ